MKLTIHWFQWCHSRNHIWCFAMRPASNSIAMRHTIWNHPISHWRKSNKIWWLGRDLWRCLKHSLLYRWRYFSIELVAGIHLCVSSNKDSIVNLMELCKNPQSFKDHFRLRLWSIRWVQQHYHNFFGVIQKKAASMERTHNSFASVISSRPSWSNYWVPLLEGLSDSSIRHGSHAVKIHFVWDKLLYDMIALCNSEISF